MGEEEINNSVEIIFNTLTADLGDRTTAKRNYHDYDSATQASQDGSDDSEQDRRLCSEKAAEEKALFDKARQYLNPGIYFRFFTYLYAERKLLTFFWVHFIATMTVWGKCDKCTLLCDTSEV